MLLLWPLIVNMRIMRIMNSMKMRLVMFAVITKIIAIISCMIDPIFAITSVNPGRQ